MADQVDGSSGGRAAHMSTADRRTLEAIFHHPVPHNLSWMDTLRLLTHLGSAEEKADGKYSLTIEGRHIIFRKPHNKNLEAREVTELRHYLAAAGVSPRHPDAPPPDAGPDSVDVVAVIDHHDAKLYRVNLASNQQGETIRPYDPHHFLHHLHHRDEKRIADPGGTAEEASSRRLREDRAAGRRQHLRHDGTGNHRLCATGPGARPTRRIVIA